MSKEEKNSQQNDREMSEAERQALLVPMPTTTDELERVIDAEEVNGTKEGKLLVAAFNEDQRGTGLVLGLADLPSLIVDALENGGFTYATHRDKDGELVTPIEGFATTVSGTEHTLDLTAAENREPPQFTPEAVDVTEEWLTAMKPLFKRSRCWWGAWVVRRNGVLQLEIGVALVFRYRDDAVSFGIAHDQKAIYDIMNDVEIPTYGSGERHWSPKRPPRNVNSH